MGGAGRRCTDRIHTSVWTMKYVKKSCILQFGVAPLYLLSLLSRQEGWGWRMPSFVQGVQADVSALG